MSDAAARRGMPGTTMAARNALLLTLLAAIAVVAGVAWWVGQQRPHNVVIFVADGLRSRIVDDRTAPEMAAIRRQGVDFADSHSLFPTVTTVNASAIATGHRIGDTGNFGNSFWLGRPTDPASPSRFAKIEDDDSLRGLARLFGNYLNEESLLAAARRAGYSTATVGKEGPAWVQDVTGDPGAILIDDETGGPHGRPLPAEVMAALKTAGIDPTAFGARGPNGDPGAYDRPGAKVANTVQQDLFTAAVTKVLLPLFKARDKPFVLVFWSRDPDGTQHGQGDSLNRLIPGINGPTSMAAIRNADTDLARIRAALKAEGLDRTTDVFVTADHGFSVVNRDSRTSFAGRLTYPDVVPGFVPRGFLAIDLARALKLKLYDASGLTIDPTRGAHPKTDGALLGDPDHPEVIIAANGGSAILYLPDGPDRRSRLDRIVAFLTSQDYLGALFVDDAFGPVPGALPLSALGLKGSARTPRPALVVGFKSFSTGCADAELCAAEFADTGLQQGQGIHGAFSRADSHNFMAAIGPDFKTGYRDPAPVSNADIAPTLARILKLSPISRGTLKGRALDEALRPGAEPPPAQARTLRSTPGPHGFVTVLNLQTLGAIDYLDAAGAPGRTVGLRP
jgi:hypothetical protein